MGTHLSFGNAVDPSFVVSGLPVHGVCSAGVGTSGVYAVVTSVAAVMVGLPRLAHASGRWAEIHRVGPDDVPTAFEST